MRSHRFFFKMAFILMFSASSYGSELECPERWRQIVASDLIIVGNSDVTLSPRSLDHRLNSRSLALRIRCKRVLYDGSSDGMASRGQIAVTFDVNAENRNAITSLLRNYGSAHVLFLRGSFSSADILHGREI